MIRRKVVMISSTARDLPNHREQVRLACERAGFEPREMMEHLTAENRTAVEVSLRMVEAADVYLGIFAYRYGFVPPGSDISITEMEFIHAVELDKPRLVFFIHKDHPVVIEDVETGPGAEKLQALKARIGEARVAAFFKSSDGIRSHVVEALTKLAKEFDAAEAGGTIASTVAKLHRKTSIPAPPEPYIAHPYTLLQLRDLVGRQAELNLLTDWVANSAAKSFAARIFCLVAIGGMGKSALTWKWFKDIAPNEMKPLAGRLWWSFYESDASFENFLIRALCYVSGDSEDVVRALPWPEREARLLQHLGEKPYLFVLDGLERILIAYHRMDASTLADDEVDQQTANVVAGAAGLPSTAAQSFVGQHRLRQAIDPRAGKFLQKLAQVTKSRILITTRLYPSELQVPTGHPRPGCFALSLPGLSKNDALALWRGFGVSGSPAELAPIFGRIEHHPLLLQALASEVANYKRAPGDFAEWRKDHPKFDPTALPLVQSRSHILDYALKGLSTSAHEVLRTLVAFRMPASYTTLEALLVGPGKAYTSAPEIDRALTELEDRGLIGWDREANRYDAHPIVRGVVWQLSLGEDRNAVYAAIAAHFEPMALPDWQHVETLADLTPAIERYHTLVGLGRYDDACDLFFERLERATLYRLAAHRERIAWLELLFPDGVAGLPAVTGSHEQGFVLGALASSCRASGQAGQSVPLYRRASEIFESLEATDNQQIVLSNFSIALREIGAFRDAVAALRRAVALSRELVDRFWEAVSLENLGNVLSASGDTVYGRVALGRSRLICIRRGYSQVEGMVVAGLARLALSIGYFTGAAVRADEAWVLAGHERYARDFIRAALMQGEGALGLRALPRADERLHKALIRARAVNLVQFELPALIALARLELERGKPAEAKARLEEVWDSAERGPYPLQQADAYNVLAAIALAEGDKPAAVAAATKAFKAAWCDGPPYAYHWGLEAAKAHLAALGAPEPDLPPFDETKYEPLPEVEINPKDEYWFDPDSSD